MESTELKTQDALCRALGGGADRASKRTGFVLFMVLARVLSPRDFGVFALAILVVDVARWSPRPGWATR